MDDKKLIAKLNWFYSLELEQVDLYHTQSQRVEDKYLSLMLKKFADIEQGHVENIAGLIEAMGATPTKIGEVAAQLIGKSVGAISASTGVENFLRFNIALEKKAMTDYLQSIQSTTSQEVVKVFWNNLGDEDLHTAWMSNKLAELIKKSPIQV